MATELELAEEMSNSSPERAMELFSSIGKPQLRMLNTIFLCFSLDVMFLMGK